MRRLTNTSIADSSDTKNEVGTYILSTLSRTRMDILPYHFLLGSQDFLAQFPECRNGLHSTTTSISIRNEPEAQISADITRDMHGVPMDLASRLATSFYRSAATACRTLDHYHRDARSPLRAAAMVLLLLLQCDFRQLQAFTTLPRSKQKLVVRSQPFLLRGEILKLRATIYVKPQSSIRARRTDACRCRRSRQASRPLLNCVTITCGDCD